MSRLNHHTMDRLLRFHQDPTAPSSRVTDVQAVRPTLKSTKV